MATHSTSTADSEDDRSRTQRMVPTIEKPGKDGSLATIAGGAALLWGARTIRKNTGRGALLAVAGAALIGVGRRQRRARSPEDPAETGITVSLDDDEDDQDEKQVSDDAHVGATGDLGAGRVADESRADTGSDADANPRGTSDHSDVEDDGGEEFDFVDGKEPGTHQETHLEDEQDSRLDADEDEQTEIDLSESAMADEASEAAGPQPEQAFPSTEGTDPEPQSAQAPPRQNEGMESSEESEDGAGADEGDGGHESEESDEAESEGNATEEAGTEEASDESEDTS